MFKYIISILLFSLVISNYSCANPSSVSFDELVKKFEYIDELFLKGYKNEFLKEFDSFIKISKKEAEKIIKEEIINQHSDEKRLKKAIFLAGLLKLKGLTEIIERVYTTDIITDLNKYFYFYNVKKDKELYFNYLKFFTEKIKSKENKPPIMGISAYHAIYLMGWLFDKNVLDYLMNFGYENLDGGLSETYGYSLDRVKLIIEKE